MNTLAADVRPAKIKRSQTDLTDSVAGATPLSRRAAMTALTAGTTAAILMPGIAGAATPSDRAAWIHAVARYRELSVAFSAANAAADDAQSLYFGRQLTRPTFVMEVEGDYGRFGKHVLPITITHDELDDPDHEWADSERIGQFRRELSDYRAADAAIRRELRLDDLEDASVKAMELQSAALKVVIDMPAPDASALTEKITIILAEYGEEDGTTSTILADVRRLSGEA